MHHTDSQEYCKYAVRVAPFCLFSHALSVFLTALFIIFSDSRNIPAKIQTLLSDLDTGLGQVVRNDSAKTGFGHGVADEYKYWSTQAKSAKQKVCIFSILKSRI